MSTTTPPMPPMASSHLSEIEILRILAFDAMDTEARALEDHASDCAECAKRVEREAALSLMLLDAPRPTAAAPESEREREKQRPSQKPAIIVGGVVVFAALALAAGVALGVRASKPTTEAIIPAHADLVSSSSSTSIGESADSWHLAGSQPKRYEKSSEIGHSSASSASSPSKLNTVRVLQRTDGPNADGFGTLLQSFSASAYAGKRVRFSADVEVRDVDLWAGLWMRADTPSRGSVAFDNMQNRPIRGTTKWMRYAVVLDIPSDAHAIALGILLAGSGTARLADPRVEIVGSDVAVTTSSSSPRPLASDFSP